MATITQGTKVFFHVTQGFLIVSGKKLTRFLTSYRVEHASLCCDGSCSASPVGDLGWCHRPSFSLEVVGSGNWRWPGNALRNL